MNKIINLAELARRMGKTRHWLYQRLNGNIVNGKPARFTPDEKAYYIQTLEGMANDLANEILRIKEEKAPQ